MKLYLIATLIVTAGIIYCAPTFVGCVEEVDNGLVPEDKSREIARAFVERSPTYLFDGYNLEYKETLYPDKTGCEHCYTFVFDFESRHTGYGNRTGQVLAQIITPHQAHVTMVNGEVTSAILDENWDMTNQSLTGG